MKIKFSCGVRKNEPSFFFEGELKSFNSDMETMSEEQSVELFNHLTKRNSYFIIECEIEKGV